MSRNQSRSAATDTEQTPATDREVDQSLAALEDVMPELDRPHVLNYQIDPVIAEVLQEELTLEPVYKHSIDDSLTHEMWRVADTASSALVKITASKNGEERVHYALPPAGEAELDLRWWAINAHYHDRTFTIHHVTDDAIENLLHLSPEEWVAGVSHLLSESL